MAETIERVETWDQVREDLSLRADQKVSVEADNIPNSMSMQKFGDYDTLEQWNAAFLEWIGSHDPTLPPLSEEAMSRESIYEGR